LRTIAHRNGGFYSARMRTVKYGERRSETGDSFNGEQPRNVRKWAGRRRRISPVSGLRSPLSGARRGRILPLDERRDRAGAGRWSGFLLRPFRGGGVGQRVGCARSPWRVSRQEHSATAPAAGGHGPAVRVRPRDSGRPPAGRLRSAARSARPAPGPHLDDKIITAWNGLMISALAKESQCWKRRLARGRWPRRRKVTASASEWIILAAAVQAAEFLRRELWDEVTGVLWRSYCEGGETCPALPRIMRT